MGGSTVFQFLSQEYFDTLAQTASQQANTILQAVTPWVQSAIMLAVLIFGKRTMMGQMSMGEASTRIVRMVMVIALLTPANFAQYITTQVTQTIPDAVTNAVNGQQNLTGAQGFDALNNGIINFAAQARKQATPALYYIGERVGIWLVEGSARVMVAATFLIWALAKATAAFIVPLGAFIIPFFIFDATREFTMRWSGKLVSIFLVMAVSIMLGSFVVKQDATYMQQYGKLTSASQANQNFQMNAGDTAFTGFDIGQFDVPGGTAAVQGNANTANVDAAIDTIWNIVLVTAFGAFLMTIMTGIALYIGGSSGFSAGNVATYVTMVLSGRAAMMLGRMAAARGAARGRT